MSGRRGDRAGITALIVDDEPLARAGVRLRLAAHPDIEVLAECSDGYQAVEKIQELDPDLVFLDVQMPGLDGFGALEALAGTELPAVIFITAYDEYALRAFRVHAVDYLLKPVEPAAFDEAMRRVRARLDVAGPAAPSELAALLDEYRAGSLGVRPERWLQRVLVRDGERIRFVRTRDIDSLETADNYVRIHTRSGPHLVRTTLAELEQALDPARFARIHRRRIVNLESVREIRVDYRGGYVVVLTDGTEHPLSRTYRDTLLARGY